MFHYGLPANLIVAIFWLCFGHAIADFALQNDYMANAKNPTSPVYTQEWPFVMAAHCMIHGGMVAFFTHSIVLGILEVVAHLVIDMSKCHGKLTFRQDQAWHLGCKVLWAACFVYGLS